MAYGSPAALDDVEAYYTHIRGGRAPGSAQVLELTERYRRIGGTSPLRAVTDAQADALRSRLEAQGLPARVYVGMKHAPPFIVDAVEQMAREGVRDAVALALAPHYSRLSVSSYFATAAEAAAATRIRLRTIESWHDDPGFVAALAARVRRALGRFADPAAVEVVFTAHSLPERILTWNDPYPAQLRATCELVADAAAVPSWRFAFQSASHTGEPWLGPDLLEELRALAAAGRHDVVVCPVGFVADHLEVLYDIEIEAKEAAHTLGLRLERAASLNDGADFIDALTDLVGRTMRVDAVRTEGTR